MSVQWTFVGLCTHDLGDVCTADGTDVRRNLPVRNFALAQLSQKRAFPQWTNAKPSCDATRQTSTQSASVAATSAAACRFRRRRRRRVDAVDSVSSSLSSSRL